jgi:hypothetical protein
MGRYRAFFLVAPTRGNWSSTLERPSSPEALSEQELRELQREFDRLAREKVARRSIS